jgi:hypothetical protein
MADEREQDREYIRQLEGQEAIDMYDEIGDEIEIAEKEKNRQFLMARSRRLDSRGPPSQVEKRRYGEQKRKIRDLRDMSIPARISHHIQSENPRFAHLKMTARDVNLGPERQQVYSALEAVIHQKHDLRRRPQASERNKSRLLQDAVNQRQLQKTLLTQAIGDAHPKLVPRASSAVHRRRQSAAAATVAANPQLASILGVQQVIPEVVEETVDWTLPSKVRQHHSSAEIVPGGFAGQTTNKRLLGIFNADGRVAGSIRKTLTGNKKGHIGKYIKNKWRSRRRRRGGKHRTRKRRRGGRKKKSSKKSLRRRGAKLLVEGALLAALAAGIEHAGVAATRASHRRRRSRRKQHRRRKRHTKCRRC